MLVPQSLQAFYQRLSLQTEDSNRAQNVMIQATKGGMEYIQSRKACDLLIKLKRHHLGTNDVEWSVQKTCKLLGDRQQMIVKMKIMRKKIAEAFRKMAEKREESSR